MLNSLYVIIMDMLQPIAEADCFGRRKIDTTQKDRHLPGTQLYLRVIIFHPKKLDINLLITIEGT